MLSPARLTRMLTLTMLFAGCEVVAGIEAPTLHRPDAGPPGDAGDSNGARTLRVVLRGNTVGHVVSDPEGIDCPAMSCSASFAPGTTVTLSADPPGDDVQHGLRFGGWDTSSCSDASMPCAVHLAPGVTEVGARFFQRVNLAFVSSTVSDGNMGGIDVADTRCAQLAAQAGLPGHYVAWLSKSGGPSALERIGSASGWVRTDGRPFARSKTDLLAGKVLYPLRLDERGRDVLATDRFGLTFTATQPDGQPSSADCGGWTQGGCGADCLFPADMGSAAGGTADWTHTSSGLSSCGAMGHIYCLETDLDTEPAPLPAPTDKQSILWLSSVPYQPGQGAIDDLCVHDRDAFMPGAAGDPRSIHALAGLPPTSWILTIAGHLPPTHFVRLDGVVPVESLEDFIDGNGFRAPLNVAADGSYVGGSVRVWLGANDMNLPATNAVCDGMTDGFGFTITQNPALATMDPQQVGCDQLERVWCVLYREEIP